MDIQLTSCIPYCYRLAQNAQNGRRTKPHTAQTVKSTIRHKAQNGRRTKPHMAQNGKKHYTA